METLQSNFEKCREAHYRRSDHHSEHFKMPLDARMLLTCRLLGRVLARGREEGKRLSLQQCRAFLERNGVKDWRYAVKDRLPGRTDSAPELSEVAPPPFDSQEYHRLLDPEFSWINELASVQHYVQREMNIRSAVLQVYHHIVTYYDGRFKAIRDRIQDYNLDKLRPDMIRAYVLYYYRRSFVEAPPAWKPEDSPAVPTEMVPRGEDALEKRKEVK